MKKFTRKELQAWKRKLMTCVNYLYDERRKCKVIERYCVGDCVYMLCTYGSQFIVLTFWLQFVDCVPSDKFFGRLSAAKSCFWGYVSEAEAAEGALK